MSKLSCERNGVVLSFDSRSKKYEICYKNFTWVSQGRKPYVVLSKKIGKKFFYEYRTLSLSLKKSHRQDKTRIVSSYKGFIAFGKKTDLIINCYAKITGDNQVEFGFDTENEKEFEVKAVYFPAPFNGKSSFKKAYAVDSMRQGMIVPDEWNKNWQSVFLLTKYWRKVNTGDCYMPLWGRVCDNNGFSAIIKTPYDATMFSCYGKKRSLLNSVNWMSSLGKIGYRRKIIFSFFDNCDYNTIAKSYRSYLKNNGELKTIDEKISINPNVKKLIGTPILHSLTFENIQPVSRYYDKKGENNKLYASFSKRAEQYSKLKEMGLEKLYIHTDGWGEMGYDNSHPYVLPPCPEAGGYDGMKFLANKCKEIDYVFAIHDQYRDFYHTCKMFDENDAITNANGKHPFCDIWAGGAHTLVCSKNSLKYLKKTYKELEEHDVVPQGVYLDVFSIMNGDECFHLDHKISRTESMKYRKECFGYLRQKGIIMSSEEPGALMVNSLDLVHHAPYAVRPQEGGVGVGISIPLNNLVYHDCVFVPWISKGIGGWGIPNGDSAKLHCILNAQSPYFEPFVQKQELLPDADLMAEISNVQEIAAIQKELYNQEMVSHKFLDDAFRKQKTTYANGTEIIVDFHKNTYEINRG